MPSSLFCSFSPSLPNVPESVAFVLPAFFLRLVREISCSGNSGSILLRPGSPEADGRPISDDCFFSGLGLFLLLLSHLDQKIANKSHRRSSHLVRFSFFLFAVRILLVGGSLNLLGQQGAGILMGFSKSIFKDFPISGLNCLCKQLFF